MKPLIKGAIPVIVLAVFLFLLFVALTRAQNAEIVASGGTFTIEKAAVAGGGTPKQLMQLNEHGTAGQAIAGYTSSGGAYSIYSGFWTPETFAPTAANVSVGGRITTPLGAGVRNIVVTLTAQSGEVRSTLSSSMGYYTFDGVEAGQTYLVSVYAKRYEFNVPSRVVHAIEDIADADFVAYPQQ